MGSAYGAYLCRSRPLRPLPGRLSTSPSAPMRTPRPLLLPLLLVFLLPFAACGGEEEPDEAYVVEEEPAVGEGYEGEDTIVYLAEDEGLTSWRTLVKQADLEEPLNAEGPFTVFIPSDEAFQQLPEGMFEELLETGNQDRLREILRYHTLPRLIRSEDLAGSMTVGTVQGPPLTIDATGETVTLTDGLGNTAAVVTVDIEADNGIIHVIDSVLFPGEGEGQDDPDFENTEPEVDVEIE